MGFILEKDMTTDIKKNLFAIAQAVGFCDQKQKLIYACEVPVYYRMIDLTMATYCTEYNEFEEHQHYTKIIRNLSSKCFDILVLIGLKGRASINLLQRELLVDKEQLKNCLEKLCSTGLIQKISNYSYKICEWEVFIPKSLLAIELKLSKWQEALEQGIYNQKFAEYSFVVLDEEKIHMNHKIEEYYKSSNVGLIYLHSDGNMKIKVMPKKNKKIDKYANEFYKLKILKDFIVNEKKWKEIK